MSALTVTIDLRDAATPAIRSRLAHLQNREGLNRSMAIFVEKEVADNFERKAGVPNKLGGTPTGYWRKAAGSTSVTASDESGVVTISQIGISLHYLGGTVTAGQNGSGKKYLTIPARAEAHGRTAAQLLGGDAKVVWGKNGPYALASKSDGLIYFWLTKKADIPKDPTTLPTAEALTEAALEGAREYLATLP